MRTLVIIFALLVAAFSAQAHQLSTAYLTLAQDNNATLSGNWQLQLSDLYPLMADKGIVLDTNQDGKLSWRELESQQPAIQTQLLSQLAVEQGGRRCNLTVTGNMMLESHANLPYLWLPLEINCLSATGLSLSYQAMFDINTGHKLIVNVAQPEQSINRIMDTNNRSLAINMQSSAMGETAREYLYQGIVHILIGTDHILFLLALLLTCVLYRDNRQWKGIDSPKSILISTTWIITAFTLAHSITLTATALNWLPSSRWVELLIALSVLFAALNNIFPLITKLGWVTFGFGLLHGMGFASVLGELGLPSSHTLLAVVAFNLGVELGQLSILLLALPVLILVRHQWRYQRWFMPAGSACIALMAAQWSIERL
ncbi:HupE/UreJ family protein [Photobacterium sp. TLY01]|uniref:HupE/UreJ family protein n=1 Tax=Photobacterium sp. TLY01 TaxID=2907534 RepID=UPI001F245806|nr:HupE/UreJ family protein [Photobacterium sp. TLY01]UIP29110.1 HupE/UreJ family protein [Photobacterium sp. TLY01]